ncbi:heavy-metal-associated domain-containing protein [Aquibacillus rhizosphaerae]|uniref:Copper chaperone CopZ n=1 Tax=Aquibacillus rhizosphaerae TaxID=3051431 RepID=A0ABT7L216_9BACI|nr:heavy metal-associated domain-containing protein [Aquibacillus sp. LR5S19]MDL4839898.1 heavy metal-associated domain-containing protein [Aquibacillus sp. LR5S19]
MNQMVTFDVKGMHCPDCPTKIEKVILRTDGVNQIKINLENENGYVMYNKNSLDIKDIIEKISKMGFKVQNIQSNYEVKI